MLTRQLWPAAIVSPQVLPGITKSPLTLTAVMLTLAAPRLVMVIVWGALVLSAA